MAAAHGSCQDCCLKGQSTAGEMGAESVIVRRFEVQLFAETEFSGKIAPMPVLRLMGSQAFRSMGLADAVRRFRTFLCGGTKAVRRCPTFSALLRIATLLDRHRRAMHYEMLTSAASKPTAVSISVCRSTSCPGAWIDSTSAYRPVSSTRPLPTCDFHQPPTGKMAISS